MFEILGIMGVLIGVAFFIWSGQRYGKFIPGKLCPQCHVRRIKLHKKCCGPCYNKYFA